MSNRSRRHRQKLTIIDCKYFYFYISKNKFLIYKSRFETEHIKAFKNMFYVNNVKLNKITAEYLWNNRFILTDYNNKTLNKIFRSYLYNDEIFVLESISKFIDDIITIRVRNKEYTFCHGIVKIKKL